MTISKSRSLANKVHDPITTKGFGAVIDGGGGTDDSAAILAADTAATAAANTNGSVTFNTGISSVGTSITLVSELVFPEGSELYIESGVTLTINGSVDAGHHVIFKGPGLVRIRDVDNPTYCSPKIDHIKAAWFSGADWCARIQEALEAGGEDGGPSIGGGKAVIHLPIGRKMDWGDNTLNTAESLIGSHAVIKGAGGMFGTEFVIPTNANGGAGIIGIDLRHADGAADEITLQDFRIIEDTNSVVSTCIRGGGTSTVVKNVWVGNANKGWLVDSAIGGHNIDNLWVESCNTGIEYTNDGATSQGRLDNILVFNTRVNGTSVSFGEGAGTSIVNDLIISNLTINGSDAGGSDSVNGLVLGAHVDGLIFNGLTILNCSDRGLDIYQPTSGRPSIINGLSMEDNSNAGGTATALYYEGGANKSAVISNTTFLNNDINTRFPGNTRGNLLSNVTEDYIVDGNSITFKNRVETSPGSFTDATAIDVFTLTFPDSGGPLGAGVEVRYTLFDSNENSIYYGVETFAVLYNGSSTMYPSAVDQVSGVSAGVYNIVVTPTITITAPGGSGTATFRISQNHSNNNNCYGEFEVRVVQKGSGGTLSLNPNQFEWDV